MNFLEKTALSLHFLDRDGWILLGSPPSRWLLAILIAGVAFLILSAFKRLFVKHLKKAADLTATKVDDLIVSVLERTTLLFLGIFALLIGSWFLHSEEVMKGLRKIMLLITFWQAGIWTNQLLNGLLLQWQENHPQSKSSATAVIAFRYAGRFLIWALVLLLILDNLGVKVVSLVAGLGVGGIAIALAVQRILGDLLSSISIILDKPFEIGDFIVLGDSSGTVEYVGLKSTRLRSLSGEQLTISNSDLLASRIRNYKRMRERRMVFTLGVLYQTPHNELAAIPELLRSLIEAQPNTRFERAHLKNFGAYAIEFEYIYWMTVPDMTTSLDVQQAISLDLFRIFEERNIQFAYPTQTLYLQKNPEGKVIQ